MGTGDALTWECLDLDRADADRVLVATENVVDLLVRCSAGKGGP